MMRPQRAAPKIFDPKLVTHSLEVAGAVNTPLNLSIEDLRRFEPIEVRDLTMICGSGRNEGHIRSYRGVRLNAILEHADVIMTEHDTPNYLYVTVRSSDGHWALFSYQELTNTAVGDQAIVVLEKDGRPLDDNEGRIAFISAGDARPGPRRMRYLQSVCVHEHRW